MGPTIRCAGLFAAVLLVGVILLPSPLPPLPADGCASTGTDWLYVRGDPDEVQAAVEAYGGRVCFARHSDLFGTRQYVYVPARGDRGVLFRVAQELEASGFEVQVRPDSDIDLY